jgi:hypothetical protein
MKIRKCNISYSQYLGRVMLSHFRLTKNDTFLPAESKSRRIVETGVKLRTVVQPDLISSNGALTK